jgi:SAM-dependent methyltransferase
VAHHSNTASQGLASEVSVHAIRCSGGGEHKRQSGGRRLVAERWDGSDDAVNWATIPMMRRRAGYFGDVLAKYVDPRVRRNRVLSLCCGHGHFERGLLQTMNYEYCDALDLSEAALENARRLASEAGVRNVNYERQDINQLNLSHPYDLAFAGGIHHLSNLEHVFAELARWLQPDAPFLMYEYIGPNQSQRLAGNWKRSTLAFSTARSTGFA